MFEKTGAKDTIFSKKRTLNIRGRLETIDGPWVMGILNVTPDSFYDGGQYNNTDNALRQCETMLNDGARIIDIGASSTRPGAKHLSPQEEINRLKAPLKAMRKMFPQAILSVDTFQAEVARAAADMGADIINDISGGSMDDRMPEVMSEIKLPYILMHIQGTPQNMQQSPQYQNTFKEVSHFLSVQIRKFTELGVADIIIDPGFGFGKSVEHNYELLHHLDNFQLFERPILVGFSRKSMINKVLNTTPENALNGTTVLNTLALTAGADILRVHDVKQAVEAVKIVTFAQNHS